jgi:hypothetical protein
VAFQGAGNADDTVAANGPADFGQKGWVLKMDAIPVQLDVQISIIEQNGDALILGQWQQCFSNRRNARDIATRDPQARDVGRRDGLLKQVGEGAQGNAARDKLGRRCEIEPAGWGIGRDRLIPCPDRS